jgi:anaerobic ribonucleoside-triphosphate reductase activating protein
MSVNHAERPYDWHGQLNLMGTADRSFANGPTETGRFVVWVQGCPLACKGCFNPHSWPNKKGELVTPRELAQRVLESGADGLTISGGEPLMQPEPLACFLKALHVEDHDGVRLNPQLSRGVILFTGFDQSEWTPLQWQAVQLVDMAVTGRFDITRKTHKGLRGSDNQTYWINATPERGIRVGSSDLLSIDQLVEVFPTSQDDRFGITGFPHFDPEEWRRCGLL